MILDALQTQLDTAFTISVLKDLYYDPKQSGQTQTQLDFDLYGLNLDESRRIDLIKGRLRESFVQNLLQATNPNYEYTLSDGNLDNEYGIDILVWSDGDVIGGLDVKGAGFRKNMESDQRCFDKELNRQLRRQDLQYPVLTFDLDLNPYGFKSLYDSVTGHRKSQFYQLVNQQNQKPDDALKIIIRNQILRNNNQAKDTNTLRHNRNALMRMWQKCPLESEMSNFCVELIDKLIPERVMNIPD